MKYIYFFVSISAICLINNIGLANSSDQYTFNDVSEQKRFYSLIKEIRCVICKNQNIAESNAPIAHDLREKIHQMIQEKQSNEAIKTYLVKRYGEFVLLTPRLSAKTFLLWTFPFLAMIISLSLL